MIGQSLKMAWKAIISNKMRAFLTMLGIIIGVVSLVVLVSIVNGATSSVTDAISSMGNNLLTVSISDDKGQPMSWQDVLELTEDEAFEDAAPTGTGNFTAKNGSESGSISIIGTSSGYYDIQGMELDSGRFLKRADLESHSYVIVLNAYSAETLFGYTDVVGEQIPIDGIKFEIVGVLAEEESSSGFNMSRMEAYIPYSTMMRISSSVKYVTSFYLTSADENDMDAAETAITNILLERFNADDEAFSIQNSSEIMSTMSTVTGTLSLMLGGIAAISLVVGGIGIMNIMLVSVTERTKEIGIRKAIGASYGNIMMQFLIEAIVVSLLGCFIGIGLSWAILLIAGKFITSMTFTLSMGVVWIAVAFSAFIGIVFGSYPANKAAKKNPIDALRFS